MQELKVTAMSNLVTVKISEYPAELAVAQTYLESEGILCFIKDELLSQVYPMAAGAWGGAKLQVPEEDVEKAVSLLIEGGFAKKEDYEIPESTMRLVRWHEKIKSFFNKK